MAPNLDKTARLEAYFALINGILSTLVILCGLLQRYMYETHNVNNSSNTSYTSTTNRAVTEVQVTPGGSNRPPVLNRYSSGSSISSKNKKQRRMTSMYMHLLMFGTIPGLSLVIKGMILLMEAFRTIMGQIIVEFTGYVASGTIFALYGWFIYRLFVAFQSTLGFKIPKFHRKLIFTLNVCLIVSVFVSETLSIVLNRTYPDGIYFVCLLFVCIEFGVMANLLLRHALKAFTDGMDLQSSTGGVERAHRKLDTLVRYTKIITILIVILVPLLLYRIYIRFSNRNEEFFWDNDEIKGNETNLYFFTGCFISMCILYGITRANNTRKQNIK